MHKSTNLQLEYRICSALGPRKRINFRADKCFQGFFKVVVLLTNSILVWSTPVWLLPLEHLECPETFVQAKFGCQCHQYLLRLWVQLPQISVFILLSRLLISFFLGRFGGYSHLFWLLSGLFLWSLLTELLKKIHTLQGRVIKQFLEKVFAWLCVWEKLTFPPAPF